MAQRSGFFSALIKDGVPDKRYNANDYCDNLAVVIGNGVLRSNDDDLRVTADGMVVSVGVGRAWINGRWYHNDTPLSFAAVSAPIGGTRYDRVFLRLDNTLATRDIFLVYQQGTPSNSPTPPAPTRTNDIYDLVLADVFVGTNATSVTITDKRADANVCGWVYSTSGDGSFFESLDNNFNEWFGQTKDTLASVTLFKRYNWRTIVDVAGKVFTFSIPQFDEETCFVEVYVNGMVVTDGVDYTRNGSVLTFTGSLVAGTEIEVKAFKSIDGTGIMSVAEEITELQNAVLGINSANNYFYNCNGVNDNVVISQMAQDFLNASTESGELTISVVGDFGATAPVLGSGTESDQYIWFDIGKSEIGNRRVTLDFSGCPLVKLVQGAKHYYLFKGREYTIKNLCMVVDGAQSVFYAQPVYFGAKNVYFENCRIDVTAISGYGFGYGTFRDCEITVKSAVDISVVFRPTLSSDVLRVYGGTYKAYSTGSNISAVVYVPADIASAVVIADSICCPTVALTGYKQTNAVYDSATSNYHRYLNIISELTIFAPSQTVRDTIVANK